MLPKFGGNTIGDLGRRFERDREFQFAETVSGPAVTPAGTSNAELSLRFGTYQPAARPRTIRLGWFIIHIGINAAKWSHLSTMDAQPIISGKTWAVCRIWKGKP